MSDRIVGSHYKLKRKIGSGSFGEIHVAENVKTHTLVAVKLEPLNSPSPQLEYEAKIYSILVGGTGIPRLHWHGITENQNVMVIDLLDKSLEDLFKRCNRKFSLKTVLMLADQMLSCIEFIHNKNFIHRDIKPDNFVMGTGKFANQVSIIDFGLAKKFRDPKTHIHIPYIEGKSLTGTARYASVNALRGYEQSRRDDLESLGYVWIYLLLGSLPWMGCEENDPDLKYRKICDIKSRIILEDLCLGLPHEFVDYMHTVKNLKFDEEPKYAKYRAVFRNLFIQMDFTYDYKYEWMSNDIINTYSKRTPQFSPPKRPANYHPANIQLKNTQKNCTISHQLSKSSVVINTSRNNFEDVDESKPSLHEQKNSVFVNAQNSTQELSLSNNSNGTISSSSTISSSDDGRLPRKEKEPLAELKNNAMTRTQPIQPHAIIKNPIDSFMTKPDVGKLAYYKSLPKDLFFDPNQIETFDKLATGNPPSFPSTNKHTLDTIGEEISPKPVKKVVNSNPKKKLVKQKKLPTVTTRAINTPRRKPL